MHFSPEAMLLGDKNVNAFDMANNLRHNPSRLNSGAPSVGQMKLQYMKAIKSGCTEIFCPAMSSLLTAICRNCTQAAALFPDAKITILDTGYLCCNSLHAREALRCAEAGMTIAEMMPRIQRVDENCYGFFVYSSATVVKLAKWGRVPSLGDGSGVKDGQFFTMGMRPGKMPAGKRGLGDKAKNFMGLINAVAADPTAKSDESTVMKLIDEELKAIADFLKPGQKLRDVFVGTPIRADMAVKLGEKIEKLLPVEGGITIADSLCISMLCQYGEYFIMYWID